MQIATAVSQASPVQESSVFRTEAWVQAWIDTWGKDPAIRLIDLGGRSHALEHVYLTKHRLKKVLPLKTLCLAGVGFGALSTPRAEYNNLDAMITMAGDIKQLGRELGKLGWSQMVVTDIDMTSAVPAQIETLLRAGNWIKHIERRELAYSIRATNFEDYLRDLGPNTRLAYFNRRDRLIKTGEVSFKEYSLQQVDEFFSHLNQFHQARWGTPCYSVSSRKFLRNFLERLQLSGGRGVMEGMTVDGKLVSVLFDIEWQNTRFNLQSGYFENLWPKISLGALHFGYAIQTTLEKNWNYDFMAGFGKNSNYKERISNTAIALETVHIESSALSSLRRITNYLRISK